MLLPSQGLRIAVEKIAKGKVVRWRGENQKVKIMTAQQTVDQASEWAGYLLDSEAHKAGTVGDAACNLARRIGINSGVLRSLRQSSRRPKTIATHIFMKIAAAYEAERLRQLKAAEHELEITRKIAGALHPVVVEGETLVGAEDGDVRAS